MPEIFNISHRGGLGEYDSVVTDGGDLSWDIWAGLAGGVGGLKCVIDDTTAIYAEKEFPQLTSDIYRYRTYIKAGDLVMGSGNEFDFAGLYDDGATRSRLRLRWNGTSFAISAEARNDVGGFESTFEYEITGDEHYPEVRVEYASTVSSNDGKLSLWIDGDLKQEKAGLGIFDVSRPNEARLGPQFGLDPGTNGILLLDEFVARDDDIEIGGIPVGDIKEPVLWHAFYLAQLEDVQDDPPLNLDLSPSTICLCLSALISAENRGYWRKEFRELNEQQWGKSEEFLRIAIEELSS